LVAAANMPVTILTIFSGEWILSEQLCVIFGYSSMITLVLSVMSLCNISINPRTRHRFYAEIVIKLVCSFNLNARKFSI
jgi:hypothetical protein